MALTRDYPTASAYTGKRIRIRLDRAEYLCEMRDGVASVKVWVGDKSAPPALIFLCDSQPDGDITIVGVCGEPVRDSKWRSPRMDYYVTVENCVWSKR